MNFITKNIEKQNKALQKLKESRIKDTQDRIDNILKDNNLSAGVIIDLNTLKQLNDFFYTGNKQIKIKYTIWED